MKLLTAVDHQSNKITNLATGTATTDGANVGNITTVTALLAPLASPSFTGNMTNTGGVVIGGTNTGLATLMVNPTVGAISTNSSGNYSGYTLAQFGTTNPLTINQYTNPTYNGYTTGTSYEIASNNTIKGSSRTVTSAGYASSMAFNSVNGATEFFSTSSSLAAGATLSELINSGSSNTTGINYVKVATLSSTGDLTINGSLNSSFTFSRGFIAGNARISWANPYVNILTTDTTRNTYGIQPANTSMGTSSTNSYGYTANMSNDPASAATASIGPTMEFSMFASVYTGNVAAKTIVRGSTNSGVILGNSTNAISGGVVSVFPKFSFGTFGTTTPTATSNVVVSEFAWFAANTGNLMLFAPTTMGYDSTQPDSGARLQVYGTAYFSGATAYGGAIITGVASAEYGTGEINRQITASATGAGSNYSTWYRGSIQMGSYGYSDTTTDVLYYNNLLGNVSINTITHSTGGNLVVPGTASFAGATTVPTPAAGDNTTNAASTAFVTTAIGLVNAAGKKVNYTRVYSTGSGNTVTYSATTLDDVIVCDTSAGGGITILLPNPTSANLGKTYNVKRYFNSNGSNQVMVQMYTPTAGVYFESTTGAAVASYNLQPAGNGGSSITWFSDATNYQLQSMR